jgi:hypothetical protein
MHQRSDQQEAVRRQATETELQEEISRMRDEQARQAENARALAEMMPI